MKLCSKVSDEHYASNFIHCVAAEHFELPCGSFGGCGLMASVRREVSLERSFQSMRIIHKNGHISSRELADLLKISNGSAYYVLNALIEKGHVKVKRFKNNQKKINYLYLLTPAGLHEKTKLASFFIQRKIEEYHDLRAEIEALKNELE